MDRDIFFIRTIMYIYIAFVFYFTLMPVITSLLFVFDHPYVPMNLVPFIDVLEKRGDYLRQIGLNVMMTIPFGFLVPLASNKKVTFPKVIIYTFILSLSIELIQPFINAIRSSDITDIITNILGGIVGYGLYMLFKPITKRVLVRIKG